MLLNICTHVYLYLCLYLQLCFHLSISSLPRDWQILNQVEKKAEFTFQYGVILRQNIWKELMTSRRRQWHPTPVLLPRKSHGQRNLVGCSPWGRYSRTRLSDFTFTFHFHALEKEMATHSSVLAWRIPGTGSLVGCRLRGCTESDTTEATQQQQQHDIQEAYTSGVRKMTLAIKIQRKEMQFCRQKFSFAYISMFVVIY